MTDSPAASSAASAPDAADLADLADRLHDAQVAWVMSELDGERFAEAVAQDVDRVLDLAAGLRLGDVVAVADVQAVARRIVLDVATSRMVEDLARGNVVRCDARVVGSFLGRVGPDVLLDQMRGLGTQARDTSQRPPPHKGLQVIVTQAEQRGLVLGLVHAPDHLG